MRRSHQFDPSNVEVERALHSQPILTANPSNIPSISLVAPLLLLFVVVVFVVIGSMLLQLGTILR